MSTKCKLQAIFDHVFFPISDQYAIFNYFSKSHLWLYFPPFQINMQLLFSLNFFHKMVANNHFGWPKISFDGISHHFISINNFLFLRNGYRRLSCITENHFFYKMATSGHFGWPKIHFDHSCRHFRSICNFYIFLYLQYGRRRLFWITENHFWSHFRSIRNFLFFGNFVHKMAAFGQFGLPIINFLPFQINRQL